MTRVMIHPYAGVLSAFGMGTAEIKSMKEVQMDAPLDQIGSALARAQDMAEDASAEVEAQGGTCVAATTRLHLRYEGSHQALPVEAKTEDEARAAFETAHKARFGFASHDRGVVIEMLSVEATGKSGITPAPPVPQGGGQAVAHVPIYTDGEWQDVPIYERGTLGPDASVKGPAIITEPTGTNMVEPGWAARVDRLGNLILDRVEAKARDHAAGTQVDPVLLEVFNNLFMSVADQMGATLANTSWSVNIKERLDFSCAIFDAEGELVANAPHVPVHLGSMSDSIKTVMRLNPDVKPGDAYMLNSPFKGGTHLPDVTVVTPVFIEDKPVFWLGSRGHHADIGGRTPGSAPPDSRHIDEEGVLIDNVRLLAEGDFQLAEAEAVLSSGKYPCRNIPQNLADLQAQVAANETGRQELLKVVDQFGLDVVQAYMRHVQDNAEESVRRVIDKLTDGQFTYPMDHGATIKVRVSVDRNAREATIDFTGTSAQHDGNYNAPKSICRAVVLYVFRTMVGADIPLNEGCLKPLDIIIPDGSMLNPVYPAAVISGNTEVSQ